MPLYEPNYYPFKRRKTAHIDLKLPPNLVYAECPNQINRAKVLKDCQLIVEMKILRCMELVLKL